MKPTLYIPSSHKTYTSLPSQNHSELKPNNLPSTLSHNHTITNSTFLVFTIDETQCGKQLIGKFYFETMIAPTILSKILIEDQDTISIKINITHELQDYIFSPHILRQKTTISLADLVNDLIVQDLLSADKILDLFDVIQDQFIRERYINAIAIKLLRRLYKEEIVSMRNAITQLNTDILYHRISLESLSEAEIQLKNVYTQINKIPNGGAVYPLRFFEQDKETINNIRQAITRNNLYRISYEDLHQYNCNNFFSSRSQANTQYASIALSMMSLLLLIYAIGSDFSAIELPTNLLDAFINNVINQLLDEIDTTQQATLAIK
ncbi:MAG: hypothetical protein Tsb005_00890 [Gammaproteobacteria bacterium]